MKRETQQVSSRDKEHGISETSPHNHDKSPSPSSSPQHDFSPSEELYHTNDFKLTAPEDQTNHQSNSAPAPPPAAAALAKPEEGVAEPVAETGEHAREEGNNGRSLEPYRSILQRARRQSLVKGALLGLRISGILFSLIAFSVMAADKNQGWASDSFSNYKELSYCLAVNVLAFVYSGIQTYDLVYYFIIGNHAVQHHLRYYFDFVMDQILSYLLISASSSAASLVEEWVSLSSTAESLVGGIDSVGSKDSFPDMARASVAFSFLAFFAFASSSLISGYTLCTLKPI